MTEGTLVSHATCQPIPKHFLPFTTIHFTFQEQVTRHSGIPCHLPTTNFLTCCFTMDNFNEADGSKGQHTSMVNYRNLTILGGSKFPALAKMQAAIFVIHSFLNQSNHIFQGLKTIAAYEHFIVNCALKITTRKH